MTSRSAHFEAARLAFDGGDYTGSLNHLQRLLAGGNVDEPAASLLGSTLLHIGLKQDAAEFFEMAAGLDEAAAFRNHRDAALAYFEVGDSDKALLNAMKGLRLKDDAYDLIFIIITILRPSRDELVDRLKFKLAESDEVKHLDLALELIDIDRHDPRSLALLRKVRKHRPDDMAIRNSVLTLASEFCDFEVFDEEEERLPLQEWMSADLLAHETPHDNLRWCGDEKANILARNSDTIVLGAARSADARRARPHKWKKKIRVGYLSGDLFPTHATMRLFSDVLRQHNKDDFEVTLFCHTPARLTATPAIQEARATWGEIVDLNKLNDVESANAIRSRDIDIIVDLKGHTANSRITLLNRGLAPVQVTWLGFPGSVAHVDLDYVIGDATVLPDSSKPFYHEKFCRLPDSYQPNDPLTRALPPPAKRADLDLPEEAFIFASFNSPAKISRRTAALWARILNETPGSVLWFMCHSAATEMNIRRYFDAAGISQDRLVTATAARYEEHIGRLQAADLGLDTFPCNGHTTTSDKLWAGLPVLTVKGSNFASRVSESLLRAIGLPELVADSDDQYVALAVDLWRNRERVDGFRQKLVANRFVAPLFDSERFCRHLENAYRMMADRARSGLAPDHFDVPAMPGRTAQFLARG